MCGFLQSDPPAHSFKLGTQKMSRSGTQRLYPLRFSRLLPSPTWAVARGTYSPAATTSPFHLHLINIWSTSHTLSRHPCVGSSRKRRPGPLRTLPTRVSLACSSLHSRCKAAICLSLASSALAVSLRSRARWRAMALRHNSKLDPGRGTGALT